MKREKLLTKVGLIASGYLLLSAQLHAQQYIPSYLLEKNDFILSNFEIVDSSGWLRSLPQTELHADEFLNSYKENLGMGEDDGFVLIRSKTDDYPYMPDESRLTHDR